MVPRITLVIVASFALFFVLALLYALPVLLEPTPRDAIADYMTERVRAHLQGKVTWLLAAAFAIVSGFVGWRTKR